MAFTPYDWQQTLRQKADYVEDRLREGSPVVGVSCHEGVLLVTVRRAQQQKIFEIYDRLAFAGLGNQSDLETIRQIAVDFAHAEGFARSPQDVSIQRVVGVALSPAMKRSFSDPLRLPLVVRGLFAQLGETLESDLFYLLNYDGEFTMTHRFGVAAGTENAREAMERVLSSRNTKKALKRDAAIELAFEAWAVGRREQETTSQSDWRAVLSESLQTGTAEAALLERASQRERRFRFLSADELRPFLPGRP